MDWILRRARLDDNAPDDQENALVDIGLKDGRIAIIGSNLDLPAAKTWDLGGRVVLPGLVDAHTHLDKTYSPIYNKSGTLLEAIEVWSDLKQKRSPADTQAMARKALQTALINGVTAMRSHLDVVDSNDLTTVEVMLDLREQMRDVIDLQFVALGDPSGSPSRKATIEQALSLGVDYVGGAPALTTDPAKAIDATIDLAERFGKPIDLHIDETEDPHDLTLEYLAEQTIIRGMQGQVTAGHCCALAFADDTTLKRVVDKVAQAQLEVITLPSCNLVLMGRNIQPSPRGIAPVKPLLAQGVNVSAASDNVHDPFNPFGSYDLLQIANLNAHVAYMSGAADLYTSLQMVTTCPAQTLGLSEYGIYEGAVADLVVIDSYSVLEAVTSPPVRLATFKAGKLVVHTALERVWHQPGSGSIEANTPGVDS